MLIDHSCFVIHSARREPDFVIVSPALNYLLVSVHTQRELFSYEDVRCDMKGDMKGKSLQLTAY